MAEIGISPTGFVDALNRGITDVDESIRTGVKIDGERIDADPTKHARAELDCFNDFSTD